MDDTTTLLLLIGVPVVLLAVGGFFYMRFRNPKQEAVYHFRCPSCNRKLRYYARQVGHRGMCGHCKEQLTFPALQRDGN